MIIYPAKFNASINYCTFMILHIGAAKDEIALKL